VEYDLMPGHRLPTLVDQVRRAVRWLQNNARKFGADPERVTVSGHSAGAHLSSYLAATGSQEASSPALPHLKGLLLVSGIYDLSGIPDSFLRHEAEMTPAEAAAWSPLDARERTGPIRVIAYGEDETTPFHEQARALRDKLSTNSEPSELLPVAGRNHMNIVLDLADPDTALGARLADLAACR
jgi:arylformamidase